MGENESGAGLRLAETYEAFFGPAILDEWANRVADAADLRPGQRVLDVACGTGILTRTVAGRLGPTGAGVGVDLSDAMLTVARRQAPEIAWHQGRAEVLPFNPASFDRVVSQFGLMFFTDRVAALREMMRVLRPGGRLTVAVWDSTGNFPLYAALADWLRRHYGPEVVEEFLAPHVLGSPERLAELFAEAGVGGATVTRQEGTMRFPSLRDWLKVEVQEFLLGDRMDEAAFEGLLAESKQMLRPFVTPEGMVVSPAPGYIVSAKA